MGTETNDENTAFNARLTKRDHPDAPSDDAGQRPAAETDGDFAATFAYQQRDFSRMEQDVAFAAVAMRRGVLSDRQIAKAVSDWTVHGDVSLSAHLSSKGVISDGERKSLEEETGRVLQRAGQDAASGEGSTDGSLSTITVRNVDSSGRIAKLLGLNLEPDWGESGQLRTINAQYKLLKKLGQGGLGCVWLTRDENLRRFVAVKEVNHDSREFASALNRFRREAEVTGRLEHPSIVPIYQFGEDTEQGRQFYVMRYLGKQTLEDAIHEYHERRETGEHNPMLLHHLLTAFVAVCQAIAYAHSRNVVHRDLKPENVALDNFGQVIVLDWGLAKLTGDAELDENYANDSPDDSVTTDQTTAGQVLGTPMYMAPEQAAGRVDEIDARTDIYGLGAILFAILTGYPPHEQSHSSLSSSSKVSELFRAIVSDPTPKARALVPEVPPELDAVCTKAMAKKRYARYSSASELANEVERWIAGEPVTAYEEPWNKRFQRWVGAHRVFSQVAAVLLTVLIVTGITWGISTRQNRLAAREAQYDSLKDEGHELEVQLRNSMASLTKEARFMASLPPIQGIINARTGSKDTDEESVWHERLQTIYQGLLNSKPDYLSVSYLSAPDPAKEIVRVERNSVDSSLVRVVPESRLSEVDSSGQLASVVKLMPGDVCLADEIFARKLDQAHDAPALVLTAGIPVYDEDTGNVFGAVAIQTNLDEMLHELISAITKTARVVYIVDGTGTVVSHYSREHGFRHATRGKQIGTLVPEVRDFFKDDDQTEIYADGSHVYAIRVPLDPRHSADTLSIVLSL